MRIKKPKRGKKLTMKKIKEIMRHHFDLKLSNEKIAICVGISKGSVHNILEKFKSQSLSYQELMRLSEQQIVSLFYPKTKKGLGAESETPNYEELVQELSKPNTTVQILFEEYREKNPEGVGRSTFFNEMKKVTQKLKVDLHIEHVGGEKLYLDYSGDKLSYYDANLKKDVEVEVFLASWGASSKCYMEVSPSQKKEDWIASNMRALRYFGGSPTYLVPDNLKSAVIKADFYDPTINEAYRKMAEHFGTTVLPARSRKPKDKAVVEANVKAVQQRIFTKIRDEKFHSFEELQTRLRELLEVFNAEVMQKHKRTRNKRFLQLDQPYLKKLPSQNFDLLDVQLEVKVLKDHHVNYRGNYYSVPWEWTGSKIEIWNRGSLLEIYCKGEMLATHCISKSDGEYITTESHRPPHHQFIKRLKPCYVLSEASEVGPQTLAAFRNIIEFYKGHCEVAVRKCLGILRLRKQFTDERIEKAIDKAMQLAFVKESDLRRMLEQNLENSPLWNKTDEREKTPESITEHENIRGSNHYLTQPGE